MKSMPLVSIIIPIYNSQAFLDACLNSIINQTYKNLEILCVNDGSTDKSLEIINCFAKKDNRIKIIDKSKNEGLFHARITGVEYSQGDYILFVDSDDSISIDWIRCLIKKAIENKADITIGNTVSINEDNWKYVYNNVINFTRLYSVLSGKEYRDKFFEQQGSCYSWHTIWNKLYSRRIWELSLPHLKEQTEHLIMTEDILFSVILNFFAQIVCFVDTDCYFYYRHKAASTSVTSDKARFQKNIEDVNRVFNFLENFIKRKRNGEYLINLYALRDKYYRIWCHTLVSTFGDDIELKNAIVTLFEKNEIEEITNSEFYFYQATTEWDAKYENIKEMVINPQYEVISFDLFDTLILRNVYFDDIFEVMNDKANELLGLEKDISFVMLRKLAEKVARKRNELERPSYEDVRLIDIYQELGGLFNLSKEKCELVMQLEIETEISHLKTRDSGIELLELAQFIGKRVIITSDMYLEKPTIISILDKFNIKDYERLYLSSDVGLLKASGSLYSYIINDLSIDADKLIHIGDNWVVDIEKAKEKGIESIFFARTIDVLNNNIQDIYTGASTKLYTAPLGLPIRTDKALESFQIRCMLNLVANKFFDKPSRSFQRESDYNGDAYFIGYYALGMFMVGLGQWIIKEALNDNKTKIVFLSRDGYLIKSVVDAIIKNQKLGLSTSYFYTSRKAIIPFLCDNAFALYNLADYINIGAHTPRTIIKLLSEILLPFTERSEVLYKEEGVILDKKFKDDLDFKFFVDALIKISFDESICKEKILEFKKVLEEEFSHSSVTFDIGYSGKLQYAISTILGRGVDVYYVHSSNKAEDLARKGNFRIKTFLDFTPAVSGVVLEYFISENSGSCIAYDLKRARTPIIEQITSCYEQNYSLMLMQRGALDFAYDFIERFGSYFDKLTAKSLEVAGSLLNYLNYSKSFDRWMFNTTFLEDEFYGCKKSIAILEIWDYYRINSGITLKPIEKVASIMIEPVASSKKWKKAIYYLLFDKKEFKKRLKRYIMSKKIRRKV